jgi:ACR3 family arsenite efflux pump ArsB
MPPYFRIWAVTMMVLAVMIGVVSLLQLTLTLVLLFGAGGNMIARPATGSLVLYALLWLLFIFMAGALFVYGRKVYRTLRRKGEGGH